MKTAGIIAEYNPFHNGHKYHIDKTRLITGADTIVVIMSGSFVQRGECAVFNKWQRAKTAVENGADLVIELPTLFSTSSAEDFAYGAVSILNEIGVDYLSFGSESGNLESITNIAKILSNEPLEFKEVLRYHQKQGLTFPSAREKALKAVNADHTLIKNPNDALGAEYLKALIRLNSTITPCAVKRFGADHDGISTVTGFLGATRIREMLSKGHDISSFVPPQNLSDPLFYEDLSKLVFTAIRLADQKNVLYKTPSDEELLNRIFNTNISQDLSSYAYNIKTKRYTMSRVKRTLLNILFNSDINKDKIENYVRVLALNEKGAS
ncbi:MAG: nucleotidyltransferase family protein, partial [Bacillota bacterium]|nr:nucleotidyltransferase family protein [Bacillota bacterium]